MRAKEISCLCENSFANDDDLRDSYLLRSSFQENFLASLVELTSGFNVSIILFLPFSIA